MRLRYKITLLVILSVAFTSLLNAMPVSALSNVSGTIELYGVANDGKTYGSLKMNLKNPDKTKTYTSAQTSMFTTKASTIGGTTDITLNYIFKNVADGKYISCIDGSEMCSKEYTIDSSNIEAKTISIGRLWIFPGYSSKYLDDILKLSKFVPGAEQATNAITPTTTTTQTDTTNTNTCGVPGVGWIICPVVKLFGTITDESYGVISKYLIIDPSIIKNDGPAHSVWLAIQSLSNILFVIAFLVIIFSQLTSVGITNYGVKKMLPRLIIAAILVNISFFLCQILVDISNIVGNSIGSIIASVANTSGIDIGAKVNISGISNNILAGIAVAATGAAGLAWASFATLIPLLIAGFVAIIVLLFILVARQALVILLIVLSPLAFVAFLLPNTAKWFESWRKAFIAMLMVYPIAGLIYGMSILASGILAEVWK